MTKVGPLSEKAKSLEGAQDRKQIESQETRNPGTELRARSRDKDKAGEREETNSKK